MIIICLIEILFLTDSKKLSVSGLQHWNSLWRKWLCICTYWMDTFSVLSSGFQIIFPAMFGGSLWFFCAKLLRCELHECNCTYLTDSSNVFYSGWLNHEVSVVVCSSHWKLEKCVNCCSFMIWHGWVGTVVAKHCRGFETIDESNSLW